MPSLEFQRSGENKMKTTRITRTSQRLAGFASAAALAIASTVQPALAAIDNTATASGTFGGSPVTSAPALESVPVVPPVGALAIVKSAGAISVTGGANTTITDGGDTITYSFTVTNNYNVTLASVTPVDPGPSFGGSPGTGTMGSFTLTAGTVPLAPGASATFTADYTLSTLDVLRAAGTTNAVANSATASGQTGGGTTVTSPPDSETTTIPAGPALTISKVAVLDDTNGTSAGNAEAGETITYTYTIENTGNVALTDVAVNDLHEGTALAASAYTGEALSSDGPLAPTTVSSDGTANDGVWSTLQPGAIITITYVHTVTQTEVDNQ
jgi:uncharacterized repeat protein (TIGR01451 family)